MPPQATRPNPDLTTKNTRWFLQMEKIDSLPDFRIDFAAAIALIGLSHIRLLPVMPADLSKPPAPLAEISQGPNAFELFLDRNQKNLIILAILIAIGVASLVVYRGIEKSRQESAGAALNKADNLAALQAVINDHADTVAARSTMILLADRQWSEGQQDAAIETLRKFISSNPDHPALPTAQAILGSKLMIQGKSADASRIFQELIDNPQARYIAPYAFISLGDIAKLAGDLDKAEASYSRVKTDFSDSGFAETAKRRIATLKAKAPVEIEPPPAPPAPATGTPAAPPAPVAPTPETPPAPVAPTPETPPAPVAPTPETPPAPVAPTPETPPTPEIPAGIAPQETSPESRSEPAGELPAVPKP
jgi:predicted negative regulator of RcsB-dependent stress response